MGLSGGHLLQPPDAQGQPLLVSKAVEADILEVLNADGGDLLEVVVPLGHEARPVLLEPQQSEPLLQTGLKTSSPSIFRLKVSLK